MEESRGRVWKESPWRERERERLQVHRLVGELGERSVAEREREDGRKEGRKEIERRHC